MPVVRAYILDTLGRHAGTHFPIFNILFMSYDLILPCEVVIIIILLFKSVDCVFLGEINERVKRFLATHEVSHQCVQYGTLMN
ncbi:hypothetical protein HanPI659440_Chr01g0007721 [Helianthus annuus]|nr:hypothetical protein HanPI659440_Chr01g0007721 [Helianthus annuus]